MADDDSSLKSDMVTEKLVIYGLSISIFALVLLSSKIETIKLVAVEVAFRPGEPNYQLVVLGVWLSLLITLMRFCLRCAEVGNNVFRPSTNLRNQIGELITAFHDTRQAVNHERVDKLVGSKWIEHAVAKLQEAMTNVIAEKELPPSLQGSVRTALNKFDGVLTEIRLKLGDAAAEQAQWSHQLKRANVSLRKLDISSRVLWTRLFIFDFAFPIAVGGLALVIAAKQALVAAKALVGF